MNDAPDRESLDTISVNALASFLVDRCKVPFATTDLSLEDLLNEIRRRLIEEIMSVNNYCSTWRSSGTVQKQSPAKVEDSVLESMSDCAASVQMRRTIIPMLWGGCRRHCLVDSR